MIGWVVFGSLLTLVAAFALSTFHYRKRARRAENKTQSDPAPLDSVFSHSKYVYQEAGGSDNHNQEEKKRNKRKYKSRDVCEGGDAVFLKAGGSGTDFQEYEDGEEDQQYFPSEEGACGDRYDRHGVRIEQNIDNFI